MHVGRGRVLVRESGLYQVVLMGQARPMVARPGRVVWRVLRVAGCLRARSRADPADRVLPAVMQAVLRRPAQAWVRERVRALLPVASWQVPALQREGVMQPGPLLHSRERMKAAAQTRKVRVQFRHLRQVLLVLQVR